MKGREKAGAVEATTATLENPDLARVSQADLWAVAKAANVFHRRCMGRRMGGAVFRTTACRHRRCAHETAELIAVANGLRVLRSGRDHPQQDAG